MNSLLCFQAFIIINLSFNNHKFVIKDRDNEFPAFLSPVTPAIALHWRLNKRRFTLPACYDPSIKCVLKWLAYLEWLLYQYTCELVMFMFANADFNLTSITIVQRGFAELCDTWLSRPILFVAEGRVLVPLRSVVAQKNLCEVSCH